MVYICFTVQNYFIIVSQRKFGIVYSIDHSRKCEEIGSWESRAGNVELEMLGWKFGVGNVRLERRRWFYCLDYFSSAGQCMMSHLLIMNNADDYESFVVILGSKQTISRFAPYMG